jgi:hypothetical protein
MSNKTISINPSLFMINSKNKTKKNIDKTKIHEKPLISPNILKNKLLNRIKEHKRKETSNLENKKSEKENLSSNSTSDFNDLFSYNDEFNDSINYLQTLSKQKKINEEKLKYEQNKQKKLHDLSHQTIKNYKSMENSQMPYVNIDLPNELKEPLEQINIANFLPTGSNISLNSIRNMKDNIPYGILKGGIKPTYRDWTRKQRSIEVNDPNSSLIIHGEISSKKNEREDRLKNLREKIKLKQAINNARSESPEQNEDIMFNNYLIQKPSSLKLNTLPDNSVNFKDNISSNITTNNITSENFISDPVLKKENNNGLNTNVNTQFITNLSNNLETSSGASLLFFINGCIVYGSLL